VPIAQVVRSMPMQLPSGDGVEPRCCALPSARQGDVAIPHGCLMRDYEQLIAAVSRLQQRSDPHEKENRKPKYHVPAIRAPLRMAIDRHVRRRLKELGDCYIQLAAGSTEGEAHWFESAASHCSSFRDTIPPHRLPRLFAAIGAVAGFAPKILSLVSHVHVSGFGTFHGFVVLPIGWLLYYVAFFYVFGVRRSFHAKRLLLSGEMPEAAIGSPPRVNVYMDEDRLFRALNRRKKPEARLVGACDVLVALAVGLFVASLPHLAHFHYSQGYSIALFILYVAFLVWVLIFAFREEKWSRANWR
jgi:hypothetical protein